MSTHNDKDGDETTESDEAPKKKKKKQQPKKNKDGKNPGLDSVKNSQVIDLGNGQYMGRGPLTPGFDSTKIGN